MPSRQKGWLVTLNTIKKAFFKAALKLQPLPKLILYKPPKDLGEQRPAVHPQTRVDDVPCDVRGHFTSATHPGRPRLEPGQNRIHHKVERNGECSQRALATW